MKLECETKLNIEFFKNLFSFSFLQLKKKKTERNILQKYI